MKYAVIEIGGKQILVEEARKPKEASKIETNQIEIQTQIWENTSLWFIKGIQSTTYRQCWSSQFSHFVRYQ